jgi:hypothetical protein
VVGVALTWIWSAGGRCDDEAADLIEPIPINTKVIYVIYVFGSDMLYDCMKLCDLSLSPLPPPLQSHCI